jgi:hypothetical protein
LLAIPSIAKPVGAPCAHCAGGCMIYSMRPQECVEFQCLWSQTPVLDEALRPDRCGVMYELYAEDQLVIANALRENAWQHGRPVQLLARMTADGYVVWIMDGAHRHLFLPSGVSKAEALARTQRAWRRMHGRA